MGGIGAELAGFRVGYLPAGVGEEVADFATEWEGVRFTTRVWERRTEQGYAVDLRLHLLRGAGLTDLDALQDFLADYQERPADWPLTGFDQGGSPGRYGVGEAFWLVAPGLAGYLLADPERYDSGELLAVARSVRPAQPGPG